MSNVRRHELRLSQIVQRYSLILRIRWYAKLCQASSPNDWLALMTKLTDWKARGFATTPEIKVAPLGGLLLFRAWGATSTEAGSGYFSLEKPTSVLDAELRFNIADWGNGVHFVSTFRLRSGFTYFVGPVAHGKRDLSRPGTQVFVETPLSSKVERVISREVLRHDVSVVSSPGNA